MAGTGPNLPTPLVARPRLCADAAGWRTLRLISIVAPTGYGKSTFVAAWLAELSALPNDERPLVAWLTLEPAGLPLDLLVQRITAPLYPQLPALPDLLERFASGRLAGAPIAQTLCTEIDRLAQHVIVVIDDAHLLNNPDALEFLQSLLDVAPPNLHLILLSRTQLNLKIGRLLLKSLAMLLDERHLRFDHEEFLAFARATRLAALDAAQLDAVEAHCDGWVAALQLLAISLHNAPSDDVESLLGPRSGRLLIEHLEAEVFSRLPAPLQQFLVDVAPLPFLTADLAAAATLRERHTCAQLLDQAYAANVFIVASGAGSHARAKFHPLFRELLLHKLLADADAATVVAVSHRAADWLSAHGDVDEALSLILPYSSHAAAVVVAAHLRPAILRFDLAAAQRWLNRLPEPAIAAHPQLAMDAAWLSYFSDACRSDLPANLERAHAALAACSATDRDELRTEVHVLHGIALYVEQRVDDARAAADRAHRMPHTDGGFASGHLHLLDALLHNRPADFDSRLQSVLLAADIFRRLPFAHGAVEAALWTCVLKRRYGDAHGALAAFDNALAVMQHFGREHSAIAVELHSLYGEHLYRMDRITDARAQFQRAHTVAAQIGPGLLMAYQATIGLQLCDIAEGRPARDFDPATDMQRWTASITENIPLATVTTGWLRMLRDFRLGALNRCSQTADSFGILPAQLTTDTHELLRLLILGGAVVAGSSDEKIGPLLRSFQREMHEARNVPIAAYAGALLVMHLLQSGNADAARTEAHTLGPYVAQSGMPRLLADFPPCARLIESGDAPTLDARFGLSQQEMRILQMLADDRANKEIAAVLTISMPTVKTHLQHIFRKLNVHSRQEAVRVWQTSAPKHAISM
jgi:ATP/maltotriose-dependent transcriptional regulator MalT